MGYITGFDRNQITLFPQSIDELIEADNPVRVIDAFVNTLDVIELGFRDVDQNQNGRPPYHPSDLLKLYIYAYMNRYRSSRVIEQECKRNIELIWLIKGLKPDHNTISNFRKDNPKAIKQVFRNTVSIARNLDLIGGILIAGDSTKLRAQNSKKNNYNQKKIDRHLKYIDDKIEAYNKEIATADEDEKPEINKNIDHLHDRKENYQAIEAELKKSGERQISTSDPESRHLITRNNITEVAYNIQTSVDAKNHIPIDFKVTNNNDSKAMGNMLQRAKSILHTNDFTALYDKGYHTGSEFKTANDLGIDVMVAIPTVAAQAPNPEYNVDAFEYNQDENYYLCPQNQKLTTTGTWHKAKTYQFKRYTTKACIQCPVKAQCTKAKYGKGIQRSEYQAYVNKNKERIEKNKDYYRKRQSIVEHPFGTIKRQWGFNYTVTKTGMKRASADVGFMFIAYNLKRLINLLGIDRMRDLFYPLFYLFGEENMPYLLFRIK